MAAYKVTGSCLCGGVKYEITKPPHQVHRCYCSICRKSIGADFATDGAVPQEHFTFIKNDTLKEYHSSEHATRCFCSTCGCTILGKSRPEGKFAHMTDVAIFLGSLDPNPGIEVECHIFVKDKAPWVKIYDNLPQCDGYELLDIEPKE